MLIVWPDHRSNHRKPIDSHGNAATTMRATISAKMYGQIRQIASSGEILPMAHLPDTEWGREQADAHGKDHHHGIVHLVYAD